MPGKNISECPAMSLDQVKSAIEYGKNLGKIMSQNTDCIVIGESLPGGTTTALAVLRGFGLNCNVSSSMQNNPLDLKNKIVSDALKRKKSDDPLEIIGNFNWHLVQIKNPSLISDVISKIFRDKFPLHFTQNMKWEFFSFNDSWVN